MNVSELRAYKPQIIEKAQEYGIENIRIALSKSGDERILSDVTLVVTPKPQIGWGFFSFAEDIENEILHCGVDVLTDNTVHNEIYKPLIGDIIPL